MMHDDVSSQMISIIFPPERNVYKVQEPFFPFLKKKSFSLLSEISSIPFEYEEDDYHPHFDSSCYAPEETVFFNRSLLDTTLEYVPEPSSYLAVIEMKHNFDNALYVMYPKINLLCPSSPEFLLLKDEVISLCVMIVDSVKIFIERGDLSSLYCSKIIRIRSDAQKKCQEFVKVMIDRVEDYFSSR